MRYLYTEVVVFGESDRTAFAMLSEGSRLLHVRTAQRADLQEVEQAIAPTSTVLVLHCETRLTMRRDESWRLDLIDWRAGAVDLPVNASFQQMLNTRKGLACLYVTGPRRMIT